MAKSAYSLVRKSRATGSLPKDMYIVASFASRLRVHTILVAANLRRISSTLPLDENDKNDLLEHSPLALIQPRDECQRSWGLLLLLRPILYLQKTRGCLRHDRVHRDFDHQDLAIFFWLKVLLKVSTGIALSFNAALGLSTSPSVRAHARAAHRSE